jgi:predicted RND superfamily exporter protein
LIDEQAPGVAIASISGVGRELREIAGQDLKRLGGAALLAIVVVVLLSFRGRLRPAVLALTPVVLGAFWTVGLWGLSGRSIDLFGVAVLPIVLGIGIDDGLHAVHGARQHTTNPIASSVKASGRAILLTTLTTMVGFGCLAFSHVPGLRRGGVLVSLAVLACLAATVLVLPALESQFSRKR